MNDIIKHLEEDRDRALAQLVEFLSIPSISAEPAHAEDVNRCAHYLAELLKADGFQTSVEQTGGHPAVVAKRIESDTLPTLLLYGHYDVQPAKMADGWKTEPFAPVVIDGKIHARGATDDKGQLFCHIMAARAHLKARGKLPVNLVMLIEGEEESGSDNLDSFIDANMELLSADAVIISDTAQYGGGQPALTYGLRGLCYLEVGITGPNRDLHSGSFGGAVQNPANALTKILGQLVDDSGRVNIPGFYADVIPLEQWERDEWAALGHDAEGLARELGVETLFGETGYTTLERMWARPTLDINGLYSGYSGKGAKTVLPAKAGAKLSCRLVSGQDPDKIATLIEARLKNLLPPGLTMEVVRLHGAKPVLLPTDGIYVESAKEALETAWGKAPVMIREGGSIPVVETFANKLGAPVVLMGFGRPDDRAHGPDEKMHLEDIFMGAEAVARFLELVAIVDGKRK